LQDFYLEIKDRKDLENSIADYLSKTLPQYTNDFIGFYDDCPDKQLFLVSHGCFP